MAKSKGRGWQFADDAPVKDYDPEDEAPSDSEAGSDGEDSADNQAATEHYVNVGKSKLRRKGGPALLGPKYRGARVSRADLDAESDDESDPHGSESGAGDSGNDFEDAREQPDDDEEDASGDSVYDDPDNADLEADDDGRDAEIDSDDALGESDQERFKDFTFRGSSKPTPQKGKRVKRPTAADFMASSEEDEEEGEEEEDDEEDESEMDSADERRQGLVDEEAEETDDDDGDDDDESMDGFVVNSDEDEEEDDDKSEGSDQDGSGSESDDNEQQANADSRAAIKGFLNNGEKSVAGSLSSAAEKDVAKGKAVREQQKKFDAVLNIRIRLQKSLVAVNSFHTVEEPEHQSEPYEAAEAAALKLWNALDGFRASIGGDPAKAGQKRKRADASTSSQDMWESMQALEKRSLAKRKAVLENWSQKARNMRTTDASSRSKFGGGGQETSLTDKLGKEMEDPERLLRRTRTPRSCAPAQVARKLNEDAGIYDDADFYQLLLKELVDQRSADTVAGSGAAATVRFAAAAKEAKAKKHVDTRASKGRKMRFNVHDKLQNFMAPEDRRSWEQSAIDRLFGTLFGQKMRLDEDEDGGSDEDEDAGMAGVDAEEAGLRLFRS